ncbi:hypothetical protein [Streptomyces huiliensis]|uniref:hypothetical protein n=1 Tax=Streptomyces huiliensis TaxID=2876027 RepID=UPI001CBD29DB|nr:hypothetical protein [Streptomyces huiliensis]MBZ4318776.1 hypothetical protein [Streptomyces huiliensis]
MARTPLDLDELVERWTLLKDEQALVSGKRGATRLGFAVLLKFYYAVRPVSPESGGAAR